MNQFQNLQQPTYLSSFISYHHSSLLLCSTGQPLLNVPRMKTDSAAIIPSFLQLHKSGIKYLLASEVESLSCFRHHLKTHYLTISWPSDCPHVRFKFISNLVALTNLWHYITYSLQCQSQTVDASWQDHKESPVVWILRDTRVTRGTDIVDWRMTRMTGSIIIFILVHIRTLHLSSGRVYPATS